jgi:hypothetical protein
MKTLLASAVMTLVFAAAARAQTDGVEGFGITVQGATVSSPGGEELRVGGGANANEPGKIARHGFSLRPDDCSWAVSRVVDSDAGVGWAVEITPLRVANDAVTFRLAWARTRDQGKASDQPRIERQPQSPESHRTRSCPSSCPDRRFFCVRLPKTVLETSRASTSMRLSIRRTLGCRV